jgi:hypothetical protein
MQDSKEPRSSTSKLAVDIRNLTSIDAEKEIQPGRRRGS